MKQFLMFLIVLFVVSTAAYAQSCYCPNTKGSTWEITTYTKKGKMTNRFEYEVLDVQKNGDQTTYVVGSTGYDKKGKMMNQLELKYVCQGNSFLLDMKQTFSAMNSSSQSEDMNIEISSSMLEYPAINTAAGTALKGGEVKASATGGPIPINFGVALSNRKVASVEEKTTPAGTFKCLKITSDYTSKIGMLNIRGTGVEWFAEGVGMVYMESYSKKRKAVCV